MNATATELKPVETNGRPSIAGVPVMSVPHRPKREGWMAKVDEKTSERLEVSKGTLALIGLAPAFLMLVFSYGSSLLGIARDDQTQKLDIQRLQSDVNDLKQDARDIKRTLQQLEVKDAFKLGATQNPPTDEKGKK